MPISDTWPGDTRMETMNGMESAGSCDSVVSVNSGFVSNQVYPLQSKNMYTSNSTKHIRNNLK